ncbi:MAG: hypothetical protein JWR45_713 [Blastococcus sp.]|jgi:L-asparaginase|nr:hypothetical protein [Blastococcus sp.]
MRPVVAVVNTGGTIESRGRDALDMAWYPEAGLRVPPGRAIASVARLVGPVELRECPPPFERCSSSALTPRHWLLLADQIRRLRAEERVVGVVVTHGTNTLEETAYFLHLVLEAGKPVVLVGSMRPFNALGSDARINLVRAVQVATSPEAQGLGVLVVMNDVVHGARGVTKSSTYRVNAFTSPDTGPLGVADADGRVRIHHRPLRPPPQFAVSHLDGLPKVDVVVSFVGSDGGLIEAAVERGAKGIVIAATGAGRCTPPEEEALERALETGVVVCVASRVGSGRVSRSPAMARLGLLAADDLQPWKARILLALALTRTRVPDELQALFDTA